MYTMEREYTELLSEYRVALGVWSEARAVYSPDQPEVAAASHLEALESGTRGIQRTGGYSGVICNRTTSSPVRS